MQDPITKKKAFRKKYIFICFALAMVIISLGTILFIKNLNKPAIGVINQTTDEAPATEQIVLKDFKNQYFSTKYSSRYTLQDNPNKSTSLQSWILTAHQALGGSVSSTIAVNIAKLPTSGAKEDSAYKQFKALPKIYTISNHTFSMDNVIIANRTDPNFEQTALWAHGKYLLSVSLTSGQKTDQLTTEMDTFLVNLTWAE